MPQSGTAGSSLLTAFCVGKLQGPDLRPAGSMNCSWCHYRQDIRATRLYGGNVTPSNIRHDLIPGSDVRNLAADNDPHCSAVFTYVLLLRVFLNYRLA